MDEHKKKIYSIFYELPPHCVFYVPYRNEWMEKICHKKKKFSHYYYCYYFSIASEAVKITKWFLSAFPLGIFLIHSTVAGIDTHEIDRVAIALATLYIYQRANSMIMDKL